MCRRIFTCMLLGLLLPLKAPSQPAETPFIPGYSYHPMREDPVSWQRLTLWLGPTFVMVAKEGQADIDSCIDAAALSMGINRLSILEEGIGAPEHPEFTDWINAHTPSRGIALLAAATGKSHLQLLALLGAYYTFQPNSYYRCRDSAEYYLNAAIRESKQLKQPETGRQALALLVKLYAVGNDARADTLCTQLINQCRHDGDKATEARVLAYRSKYTPPLPTTIKRKLNDAQQAADIYQKLGDAEDRINALVDLGYLQIIMGQLQEAYSNHLLALKLAEDIHYPYTHYITQALVTITTFQGKFGEPLRYSYQTIRTSEATRDSLAWSYFYTNVANMSVLEGRVQEGAKWAQKSVTRFAAQHNPSVYRILNQVQLYICENESPKAAMNYVKEIARQVGYPTTASDQFAYHQTFSNCCMETGLLDEAEMHINRMNELETQAEKFRGPMRRTEITIQYGFLYLKRKQYRKARAFFEKKFSLPDGLAKSLAPHLTVYVALIEIDSILGDHTAELAHYRQYTKLMDSSFKISRTRQAEELQVVYQMYEKENQITSLTQQAKLEKANSEKSELLRNFSMGGIAAALIIAGLLYRQSRLRKKSNQEISRKNGQLEQLVADKEWLLKEIHHRVKNNLQIIISLLDSQSEYINNDAALAAIEDNMRRVHAMALIHQKLYLTDDVSSIDMPEYINELVLYARDSFDSGSRITFEQEVEPIDLDVSQAIPLGLIVNESIVNAIKYAFPDGRKGVVHIQLYQNETGELVLKTSDNGIGLPEAINIKTHPSLGLNLMQGLTRQLNGSFTIENNNGLHLTVRFAALNNHISQTPLTNL